MSKLNWPDAFSLLQVWLALAGTDIRLRLHHRFNRSFLFPDQTGDDLPQQPLNAQAEESIDRLSRLVAVAARFHGPFNFTCLRQALVLRSRLRAHGIASRLVYGVKKENSNVSAHAWLEAGGKTINSIPDINTLK